MDLIAEMKLIRIICVSVAFIVATKYYIITHHPDSESKSEIRDLLIFQ